MVVVCESCSTRFRIDDAQIPAKGRLVRCSQCKATFIAKPEAASFEETVREVVEEIAEAGGAHVPEPAADLFDVGGEDLGSGAASAGAGPDDERWEFDESPRAHSAGETAEEHDAFGETTSPLEEVGDPADWDLLRDSVEPAAREAKFVEPAPAPQARPAAEPVRTPLAAEEPKPRAEERPALRDSIGRLGRLGLSTAAWCALAVLCAVGVTPLLPSDAGPHASRLLPKSFALPDGEARGVQASFVENAFAGMLLVVRGELARPAGDPRLGLRVHLVSASGARVGEGRWAGVDRPAEDLRVLAPETLVREIDASAATAARGGRFVAVFEAPGDATQLELALEPLPLPEPPAGGPGAIAPPALPAAGDATASSAPASPPSSE